jgi:hypothetical protein
VPILAAMKTTAIKAVAAIGAGAALVVAGAAISGTNSPEAAATTASATQPATPSQGAPPQGFGTPVTGAEAERVAGAATAEVDGDVERVVRLPDGSYVVHVITPGGEQHVLVSKDLEVTGSEQGGPGFRPSGDGDGGGGPAAPPAPPSGSGNFS